MKCAVQASQTRSLEPCRILFTSLWPFLCKFLSVLCDWSRKSHGKIMMVLRSLTSNNPAGQNYKLLEPNVSHSTSLPCLIKNDEDETLDFHPLHSQYQANQNQRQHEQPPQQQHALAQEQRALLNPTIQQRSVSLSTLQPKVAY